MTFKAHAIALITLCSMMSLSAGAQEKRIKVEAALQTCQTALKQASRDPEKAKIPGVGAMKGGADWRFLWNENSRMVRMRNGLGNEVAAIALCVVDEDTGRIKLLTLDGKQLVAPGKQLH